MTVGGTNREVRMSFGRFTSTKAANRATGTGVLAETKGVSAYGPSAEQ